MTRRARSIPIRRLTRHYMRTAALEIEAFTSSREYEQIVANKPRTRADCKGGPRPCPWVSCSEHLYLDVNPKTGTIKLNFPDLEVDELAVSCALDVADDGPHSLEETGDLMNLTRERVRQVELRGLVKLRPAVAILGVDLPPLPANDEVPDDDADDSDDTTVDGS